MEDSPHWPACRWSGKATGRGEALPPLIAEVIARWQVGHVSNVIAESIAPPIARDWPEIRGDFPILDQAVHGQPLIYFDNAATSQKPRAVIDALRHYYERDNANVHRGLHELSSRATEAYEAARERVARFIGAASADEIVFTRGTTEGINLVAQSWGGNFLRAGDVVLLTEMEHHSNLVPWQLLAERTGARLRFVPVRDDGPLDLERLPELLTPEVKLFAFTHISNSLGTINPVADLCRAARAVGAVTLVDAAQSAGHLPVERAGDRLRFLRASPVTRCADRPASARSMAAPNCSNAMPPWHGGGEMIVSVSLETSTFKTAPHRFEAGTPNIAGAIGLAAAMRLSRRDRPRPHLRARCWRSRSYAHRTPRARLPGLRILGPRERTRRARRLRHGLRRIRTISRLSRTNHGLALRGGHHCNQPLMRKIRRARHDARAVSISTTRRREVDRMIEILSAARRFFA